MRSASPRRVDVEDSLNGIKELGNGILDAIQSEDFDRWGHLLHEHWMKKKRMSEKISVPWIDELYDEVRARCGVLGGKIIGAGGGGFLMLYCPSTSRKLEDFMLSHGLPRLHYDLEREGTKVVANVASTQAMILHPAVGTVPQRASAARTAGETGQAWDRSGPAGSGSAPRPAAAHSAAPDASGPDGSSRPR